ncbi:MAG TPA: thiamine phosphate synthase [Candidatus Binatia bacterium]|nr:thiamine phosphate synthase [Candidatus Binatia bacterium]
MPPPSQRLQLPPLYAILDPEQTKGRAAETALLELLKGGIKLFQLRAKVMSPRDFLQLACATRGLTHSSPCKLIVNDRVDIALACGADGVHLGQEDLPPHAARKLMGDRIIGISTHDVEQAKEAEASGADYIGFGPMFGTPTKETGYSARGLEMLRRVREVVTIPIVAIGGITEANVAKVWQAGADAAAIISDLLGADDVADKVKRIISLHQAL